MLIKGLGESALIFSVRIEKKTFTTGNGIMLFDSRCNWGCWTKTNNLFQILQKKEHFWDRHSPVLEKQGDYLQDMWMDGSIYIRIWLGISQCALTPVDRPISEGHNYTIPLRGIVTMEGDAAFTCNFKYDLVGFMKQYKSTLSFLIRPKSLPQSSPTAPWNTRSMMQW